MLDIMQGWKMLDRYDGCSIFIKRNCFMIKRNDPVIENMIESSQDSSINSENSVGQSTNYYDESDHYMKNYKLYYSSTEQN